MSFFHDWSDVVKGNLLMLAGIILLLNALGVTMRVIFYLTIAGSILMIIYGFVQAGYYRKIMDMFKGKTDGGE